MTETTTTAADRVPAQVYDVFIQATPEAVWDAITTPEWTERYFFGVRISITEEGYRSFGPDGSNFGHADVLEFDPPRRLVHGWRSLYDPALADEPESRVTWVITPGDDGVTRLTVVHDRLDSSPGTAAHVSGAGWMRVLSGLKTLLETGTPLG